MYSTSLSPSIRRPRRIILLVSCLLAVLTIGFLARTERTEAATTRPTVVLVHGAFADGSSWNGVSSRLQRAGHPVLVPALPMRGLGSDADYLASVLRTIEGPVVLAGHSYAGIVIGQAAAAVDNVEALVFVDGFALDVGESAMDIGARFPMNLLGPALISRPYPVAAGGVGSDLYVDPAKFPRIFAADLPPAQRAVLAASQRPIEAAAFSEEVTAAAWKTIPSSFVFGARDRAIDPAALRFLARRAGGAVRVVRGGSHLTLISHAPTVAKVIVRAAR